MVKYKEGTSLLRQNLKFVKIFKYFHFLEPSIFQHLQLTSLDYLAFIKQCNKQMVFFNFINIF